MQEGTRTVAGRVALVTGSASGIGRATAELFAAEGAKVAVVDLDDAAVEAVVDGIRAAGGEAEGWVLDVSDPRRVQVVVDAVADRFGRLDVVVNNAGVSAVAGIDDTEHFEAVWERTIAVNLTAVTTVVRAALPHLRRSDAARIVNLASTEGVGAQPKLTAYVAAKHGVVGLTRSMAVDLGREGITVNAVCPGPIRTGMTEAIPEEAKATFARRKVPMRRYGEPAELAQVILSIALPASSYLTGAIIPVDGGMTAMN